MRDFILTEAQSEEVVLVGLITGQQTEREVTEYLDELAFLSETAGLKPTKRFVQRLEHAHPVTFVGKGKLEEIQRHVAEHDIGTVIFDDELSPKQLRHVEAALRVKILDRTSLILDIFALRAKTAYAKTQVELAQYRYMLPRLHRLWTHLDRQRGGVGMRGPGETELETDRRLIQDRITHLKSELKVIDRQMAMQRKHRGKLVRVALVGYTNVGKSTLMNILAKSEVFAENKLFATLDTTVRKVIVHNLPFLLSDTVGFIRKLPTELIESFKSTLDEVREADILVHVIDVSHPNHEEQIEIVTSTLRDICGAEEKPTLLVFNKLDAYHWIEKDPEDLTPRTKANTSPEELVRSWQEHRGDEVRFISAKQQEGIDELKSTLYSWVRKIHTQRFPYNDFLFDDYSADA